MHCSEFHFPILSVSLLANDVDIAYNVPSSAVGQDYISVDLPVQGTQSSLAYATLLSEGQLLLANDESFKLSQKLQTKQGGQYQQVTLEYTTSPTSTVLDGSSASVEDYHRQQSDLRQNSYSLLLEFFDGTQGLIRAFNHGDGWLFSSKQQDGTTTNTIAITNLTGIQLINPATDRLVPPPPKVEDEEEE